MTLLDQLTEGELVPLLEDADERIQDAGVLLLHEHDACCGSCVLHALLWATIKLSLEEGLERQAIHALVDRFRQEGEAEAAQAGQES